MFQHIHRHFLGYLIVACILGACFPGVGEWLGGDERENSLPLTQSLLGIVVFLSTLHHYSQKTTNQKLSFLVQPIICVALVRLIIATGLLLIFISMQSVLGELNDVIRGALVVMLMPVAFSSIAWSLRTNANGLTSLFTVFSSSILSAAIFVIAGTLILKGLHIEVAFSRVKSLYLFFIMPALLVGTAIGLWASKRESVRNLIQRVPKREINLVLILILNYVNAASAFPGLLASHSLSVLPFAVTILLAVCTTGFLLGEWFSRKWVVGRDRQASSVIACGMYNTGMAQVVILLIFPGNHWALFSAVLITILQHFGAALYSNLYQVDSRRSITAEKAPTPCAFDTN